MPVGTARLAGGWASTYPLLSMAEDGSIDLHALASTLGFRNRLGPWPIHLPSSVRSWMTKKTIVIEVFSNRDGDTYALSRESKKLLHESLGEAFTSKARPRVFLDFDKSSERELNPVRQEALAQLLTTLMDLSAFEIEFKQN